MEFKHFQKKEHLSGLEYIRKIYGADIQKIDKIIDVLAVNNPLIKPVSKRVIAIPSFQLGSDYNYSNLCYYIKAAIKTGLQFKY